MVIQSGMKARSSYFIQVHRREGVISHCCCLFLYSLYVGIRGSLVRRCNGNIDLINVLREFESKQV